MPYTLAQLTAGVPLDYVPEEYETKLSKAYARKHGYAGAQGGWIWRLNADGVATGRHPVCQGWRSFWSVFKYQILDELAAELTAWRSFAEFTHPTAHGATYRPTLLVHGAKDWRYDALACAYDHQMKLQHDPRRAYRGARDGMDAAGKARLRRVFVARQEADRAKAQLAAAQRHLDTIFFDPKGR